MRAFLASLALATALICGASSPAWADAQKGEAAYERGDYRTAFKEWLKNAEQGEAWAQRTIGAMYLDGEGVQTDYGEALKWLRRAAIQLDSEALFALGAMHYAGTGVEKNHAAAFQWWLKAAREGDFDSIMNVIQMYASGSGVETNLVESYKWASFLNRIAKIAGEGRPDIWSEKERWSGEVLSALGDKMSAKEISKAEKLAERCFSEDVC